MRRPERMSTNALIACIRALAAESQRLERRLAEGDLTDEAAEDLGLYAKDLNQALWWIMQDYEDSRSAVPDLPPADRLLERFTDDREL
ncbi:hypothetical protein [Rhodospirillaceae bacterium SYSU D60014]|uniref:hypothetical protein n=1 Tax=Virgifigura deserti TaxID=2268457 RepID=UPI000E65F177